MNVACLCYKHYEVSISWVTRLLAIYYYFLDGMEPHRARLLAIYLLYVQDSYLLHRSSDTAHEIYIYIYIYISWGLLPLSNDYLKVPPKFSRSSKMICMRFSFYLSDLESRKGEMKVNHWAVGTWPIQILVAF